MVVAMFLLVARPCPDGTPGRLCPVVHPLSLRLLSLKRLCLSMSPRRAPRFPSMPVTSKRSPHRLLGITRVSFA